METGEIIIVIVCVTLAAISHAIFSLIAHQKFTFGDPTGFWGSEQWKRKYKLRHGFTFPAPRTWYYKAFNIKYRERFPLSATALVFITDGFHLTQWLTTKLLFLAITRDWFVYVVIWIVWSIMFNVTYSRLSKT